MQYVSATQPETFRQQISRSVTLYKNSFLHVFLFALLLSVIVFIPRLIDVVTAGNFFAALTPVDPRRLWLVLIEVAALGVFTAMLWRIQCLITNTHETVRNDLTIALKKLPPIFVAGILQAVALFLINIVAYILFILLAQKEQVFSLSSFVLFSVLFLLQFIAAIYILFLFYFYLPLILTENNGIISALKRSALLVWKNWWRTLCVQLFPWSCYLIALLIIKSILGIDIHIYFSLTQNTTYLTTVIHILVFAIFIPWAAATMLVQLRDLELRKPKI